MEAAPEKPRDKERRKLKRASRRSMLDGIPRDQMKRFRIVDLALGPSSSSGSKRTRSPGGDALPDAKMRATVQDDANNGSKGNAKASQLLEDERSLEKRKKEAGRVQHYRNAIDHAYDKLRAALYPGEEKHQSVRSDHRKLECIRDAVKWIRTSTPNDICQQKEAALYARIRAFEANQGLAENGDLRRIGHERCYEEIEDLHQTVALLQMRLAENRERN